MRLYTEVHTAVLVAMNVSLHGALPEVQGQNIALTVLYVPYSLVRRHPRERPSLEGPCRQAACVEQSAMGDAETGRTSVHPLYTPCCTTVHLALDCTLECPLRPQAARGALPALGESQSEHELYTCTSVQLYNPCATIQLSALKVSVVD